MLRKALKISRPLALVLREVPRFHGGSLWHVSPGHEEQHFPQRSQWRIRNCSDDGNSPERDNSLMFPKQPREGVPAQMFNFVSAYLKEVQWKGVLSFLSFQHFAFGLKFCFFSHCHFLLYHFTSDMLWWFWKWSKSNKRNGAWNNFHLKDFQVTHVWLTQLDKHLTSKLAMVSVVSSTPTGGNFIFCFNFWCKFRLEN